jgi:RNA polymerase sigma-70 factor (ECF subfamily)
MNDIQLLEGCQKHQVLAQEALYNRYSAKMLGVCYRYANNRADAEDMLQEGFIRVFSQIHQYRNEGSLEGWIRKVIVHTCINVLKKNRKFYDCVDISIADHLETKIASVYAMMQTRHIIECIRLLPIGYRTVLNLYAIEGYSHREIARILEIEEGTSRSQYARAKIMLESILLKRGVIEEPFRKIKNSTAG